ncbi:MAG: hypothetical protein HFI88_14225 [Lachnospiraceae bacterium]|nr:hypothetical protein [Lachnospiraceae bacterium]
MKKVRRLTAILLAAVLSVSPCMNVYSEEPETVVEKSGEKPGTGTEGASDTGDEAPAYSGNRQEDEEEGARREKGPESQAEKESEVQPEESPEGQPEKNAGDEIEKEEPAGAGVAGSEKEDGRPARNAASRVEAEPTGGSDAEAGPAGGNDAEEKRPGKKTVKTAAKAAASEEPEISVKASRLEEVKKMIADLPILENVKASDAGKIQAAWDAYHALGAEDRDKLDSEMGSKSGQSYGRDLESAYWGLQVLKPANASTSLPEGIYDGSTDPALFSEYSKGKSSSSRQRPWSVKSVAVDANGQATGVITVESDSYTYIRTNGKTYKKTNISGNSEFAGVPIDLNSTFYIAAFSTSMNGEIAFSITTRIDEGTGSGTGDQNGQEVPLTGISLSEERISMFAREIHEPLAVILEPENTTYKGGIIWSSSDPEVVSVDPDTGEISALAAGRAVVTARAGEFSAACTVEVSEKAVDGRTDLSVTNKTAMFKVTDAYLITKKGKTTLYITLGGDGYRELFVGTYRQAVATGSDSSQWIKGKKRSDNALLSYVDINGKSKKEKASGKWQFAIPVSADISYLQVQSLSHGHKKDGYWWYPRQFSINTENKSMVVDDYKGTQSLTVKNSAKNLPVSSASLTTVGGPRSNNYKVSLAIKLRGSDYSKAFLGTAGSAKKKGADIFSIRKNRISFTVEQIVGTGNEANIASRIGTPFALSVYAPSTKKWTCFEVTVNQKKGSVTIRPWGKDSQDKGNDGFQGDGGDGKGQSDEIDPSRLNANSSTMPGAVDNSTTLADGIYGSGQFRFTFSGGSGRVVVGCKRVEVKSGRAYADITFSRSAKQGGACHYDSVRANGKVYSGNNTFTIPVRLNKNNTIVGRTVSMSAPHWVEYTIFIGITEPGSGQGQDVSENTTRLDETAPAIMGLQGGKALEFRHSEKLKVFEYENGYYLIEVDTAKGDAFRDTEAYREYLKKRKDTAEEQTGQESTEADAGVETEIPEEEGSLSASGAEDSVSAQAASLYASQIIKYLVIPEGEEAPAGLEKEVILISQPLEQVYVSSESALEMLGGLSLADRIDSVGIEKEELEKKGYGDIVRAMELPEEEESHISWGGRYDDWEFRTMLLHGTDLMIETADILPDHEETLDGDMEQFVRLAQRSYQMGAAMFLDCSGEEKSEEAKAEWYKVYGILFHCRDRAQDAYEAVCPGENR